MNLHDAERLVRKMTEVLQQQLHEAQTPQLAQDYAEACRTAGHRLDQCAAMLGAGDDLQALQLAEVSPPLLDLISILTFRQVSEWRTYCKTSQLPVADPLDAKSIRLLNELYSKGISNDHPLYRDYREAMLRNDEERALPLLRSICRLNPSDPHSARDVARLDKKILKLKLDQLAEAVRAGNKPAALQWIQDIEAARFSTSPQGELWQQAQALRGGLLLEQVQSLRDIGDWQSLEPLLEEIKDLCAEHSLQLDPNDAQVFDEASATLAANRKAVADEQDYQRTLAEAEQQILSWEEKQLVSRHPSQPELCNDLELLARKWRALEQFDRPLPEELEARCQKCVRLLRAQIARKAKGRQNALITFTVLFLIVAVIASGVMLWQRKSRNLAEVAGRLVADRLVLAAEKFSRELHSNESSRLNAPDLKAGLERLDGFVRQEREQQAVCEAMLKRLTGLADAGFVGASPEQVQAQFEAANQSLEKIAPDLKPSVQAGLLAFQNRWEEFLDQQRQSRNTDFQKRFQTAQAVADQEVNYSRGPAAVRASLSKLEPLMQALSQLTAAPLPMLRIQPELLLHFETLKARLGAVGQEVAQWEKIKETFRTPASLEDFLKALNALQKSEFADPAQSRLAGEITALNVSVSSLAAGLLLPGQRQAWAAFENNPAARFFPDEVMPAERTNLLVLRNDHNIQNIRMHKVTEKRLASDDPRKTRILLSQGPLTLGHFAEKTGLLYDPTESPGTLKFTSKKLDGFDFLFHEEGIEGLDAPEFEAYGTIGMNEIIDNNSGKYRVSLLRILDQLNEDKISSPIFRAYLAMQVFSLMDLQPLAWGGQWSPSLAQHRQQLLELNAAGLRSGDWLVPQRINSETAAFERYFTQARTISYLSQAKFFNLLARRTVETGFSFAGFVDAGGQLVLAADAPQRGELWGWGGTNKVPVLLFRQSGNTPEAVSEPVRFTPLFAFRADRAALLTEVARSAVVKIGDSAIQPFLPPLFAP